MRSIIVVAEDDFLISMLIEDILTDNGYSVVTVANADEALAALARVGSVAALLTDIDMPGTINGLELAAKLATTRPDLPVIVASGKHRPSVAELGEARFLGKPFLGEELIAIVDEMVAR